MRMSRRMGLYVPTFAGAPEFTYSGTYSVIDDGGGNWRIKFLDSGTLTFTKLGSAKKGIDVFLVGGGGGGAGQAGGGAGGGGYTATHAITEIQVGEPYTITIGTGGAGRASSDQWGTTGGQTSAFGKSVNGGQGGSSTSCSPGRKGGNGGSGGGGGGSSSGNGGAGGKNGGNGTSASGSGGTGQGTNTYEFGEEASGILYAGGGGGKGAAGGDGGGGKGGSGKGTDNKGGGGGGSGSTNAGGKGGSGIVIIRNSRS